MNMSLAPHDNGNRLISYDRSRRRVWVANQRLHHGLTGLVFAIAGALLMAHDWKDRQMWFERGPGRQP